MFYLHVPKTGGQTLATRLASAFDPDKVHVFKGDLEFPRDSEKLKTLLREKEFIESHVAGAMLSEPIDHPILCTIREPVGQMVSNWLHIRREPKNRWHRAAVSLSPEEFFDIAGDDIMNHQTNGMLSAFFPIRALTGSIGYYRAFNQHLQSGVDRIRWLVPTESIDEFLDLWSAETKRRVHNRWAMVNVAPPEAASDRERGIIAVRAKPHVYAFDQVLYEMTKIRFAEYRREVAELIAPWSYPDDSRRACRMERGGIWLTDNWYDPEITNGKRAWWCGPQRVSEVRIWRANGERFLKFFVRGVNGITYLGIVAKAKETGKRLPMVCEEAQGGNGMHYTIDLDTLGERDTINLVTPECYPSIVTTKHDMSLVRQSFIATDWTLSGSHSA
jgi:hypothetical protein